jgi:predicted RNA-binding Zn-ribbon protein involved in translation (DUF1610 family)
VKEYPDLCAECGTELPDEVPGEPRQPCPNCGSLKRTHRRSLHSTVRMVARVGGEVFREWDGLSLTLFLGLYGFLAYLAGLILDPHGTLDRVIFAVVAVAIFFLALWLRQPVIATMRRLLRWKS